jgi:phage head maturation protease
LPPAIPIHIDHTFSSATTVARGRPYYDGERLMVEATFASTRDAQDVRQKVADGVLDSLSIAFRGLQWKDLDGVRTCVKGELLAAEIVSVRPTRARGF